MHHTDINDCFQLKPTKDYTKRPEYIIGRKKKIVLKTHSETLKLFTDTTTTTSSGQNNKMTDGINIL